MKPLLTLTAVASVCLCLGIIGLGACGLPAADDYALLVHARTLSAFDLGLSNFYHWDGRFIHFTLISALLRDVNTLFLVTMLWATSFVAVGILCELLLSLFWSFPQSTHERLTRIGIVVAVLWMGMRPILGQTVYWATAGVYTLWAALGLWWLCSLAKKIVLGETFSTMFMSRIRWFLSSVFIGALTQNLSVPLLLGSGVLLLWLVRKQRRSEALDMVWIVTGLLLGFGSMMIAPGLYARADSMQTALQFHPSALAGNLWSILLSYLALSTKLIPFIAGAAVLLALLMPTQASRIRSVPFPGAWFWFVLAMGSVLPMVAVPELGVRKHTATYFQIFLALGTFQSVIPLAQKFIRRFMTKHGIASVIPQLLAALLLFQTIFFYSRDLIRAVELRREVYGRHHWIIQNARPHRDLTIPRIKAIVPTPIFFYDLRSDPEHDINVWAAEYYRVRSIKVDIR